MTFLVFGNSLTKKRTVKWYVDAYWLNGQITFWFIQSSTSVAWRQIVLREKEVGGIRAMYYDASTITGDYSEIEDAIAEIRKFAIEHNVAVGTDADFNILSKIMTP